MALEDLMEKTTKVFPKPITLIQLRWLCNQIATALDPFEVRLYGHHSERYGKMFPSDEREFTEQRLENLTGEIGSVAERANFTLMTDNQFDSVGPYTGLQFDTMPYDRYEEIPEARRKVMEQFGKAIDDYFKSIQ